MLLRDVPRRAHHAENEVFSGNKSLLSNDKLVITFNFKNEPVTVPTSDELDAIEGSSDIKAFASPPQESRTQVLLFLFMFESKIKAPRTRCFYFFYFLFSTSRIIFP